MVLPVKMDDFNENESDFEFESTPPNITEAANSVINNLLPKISKKRYEDSYQKFMLWRNKKNVTTFSENVLLAYFGELSKK